jgi:uncharacterized membrane protein YfcA
MVLFLTLLVGFLCGFLNTVVSSGSAVTLPFLLFLGLPPAEANATNRLPVLLASVAATIRFKRAGLIDTRVALWILAPSVGGAVCGVWLAERMQPGQLRLLSMLAIVIALMLLLGRAREALVNAVSSPPRLGLLQAVLLFLVGLWLGLIVLDGATFLLLTLILAVGMPLMTANAYKNLTLAVTSALAVLLFGGHGDIDWKIGGVLALGGLVGGIVGAKFAMAPAAARWTYRLLITIIVIELALMVWEYLMRS